MFIILLGGAVAWGDFPSWLAACATVAAVAAAVWAGVWAKRLFKIESSREGRTIEDRRVSVGLAVRAQAGKVAVWWTRTEQGGFEFWAGNFSNSPVFDVTVRGGVLSAERVYADAPEPSARWPVLVPLPLGQRVSGYPVEIDELRSTMGGASARLAGTIQFTDAAGSVWFRDGRGDLRPVGVHKAPGMDHQKDITDSAN